MNGKEIVLTVLKVQIYGVIYSTIYSVAKINENLYCSLKKIQRQVIVYGRLKLPRHYQLSGYFHKFFL